LVIVTFLLITHAGGFEDVSLGLLISMHICIANASRDRRTLFVELETVF
jgi:hypothetical protein